MLIRKLLDGLLIVEDHSETHDRRWRWCPFIRCNRRHVAIGFELMLTRLYGVDLTKPILSRLATLQFRFRPSAWRWGREHTWYDGEHCSWMLGPLQFHRMGWSCRDCAT